MVGVSRVRVRINNVCGDVSAPTELRAVDHRHQEFVWGSRVPAGTVWVPTVAWTGRCVLSAGRAHRAQDLHWVVGPGLSD
jgi:hypothetical protein